MTFKFQVLQNKTEPEKKCETSNLEAYKTYFPKKRPNCKQESHSVEL